jgi:hypothetical protein
MGASPGLEDSVSRTVDNGGAASCRAAECDRSAQARGLCVGHLWRENVGLPLGELRGWGREPLVALWDAVFDLLDLPTGNRRAWRLAKKRVLVAVGRYSKSVEAERTRKRERAKMARALRRAGKSFRDIAARLEVSVGTAHGLVARGHEQPRASFNRHKL